MAFAKLWTIAYRDLGRNRRRTILTLIAVAFGLALVIFLNLLSDISYCYLDPRIKMGKEAKG